MKSKKITRGQFMSTSLGLTIFPAIGQDGSTLGKLLKSPDDSYTITEPMKAAYETALNILKPTKAQLEHGLELHRNSLVFDAYGKMPRNAVDGAVIAEAINNNASALEIDDLRLEHIWTRCVTCEREREEYKNAWKASGVTCVFTNAGEEGNAVELILKRLAYCTYVTDMIKDIVIKAVTPDDILLAKKENKHAICFTSNGVPLPQDWVSVEEELRYIKVFFQLGVRMMHLTYNRRNVIGDGCSEKADGGLSDFGRAVVKEMNKVGVIVDNSHSGWQTSLEAAQISEKPMVASHSTAASVNNVVRSKPDNVIKAVADTGGFIGITGVSPYLGGTGDIAALMKHIDYVVKKFGPDYVAIGFDKGHGSQFSAEENRKIPVLPHRKPYYRDWESLWPDEPFTTTSEMTRSLAWTNWPLFTVGMVQMGYSDYDIQKIIGGNAIRVLKAVLA